MPASCNRVSNIFTIVNGPHDHPLCLVFFAVLLVPKHDANDVSEMVGIALCGDVDPVLEESNILHPKKFSAMLANNGKVLARAHCKEKREMTS